MKLHLPVKLRASVLAAIVAVPALIYNQAFAEVTASQTSDLTPVSDGVYTSGQNLTISGGFVDGGSSLSEIQVTAGNSEDGDLTIESTGALMNVETVTVANNMTVAGSVSNVSELTVTGTATLENTAQLSGVSLTAKSISGLANAQSLNNSTLTQTSGNLTIGRALLDNVGTNNTFIATSGYMNIAGVGGGSTGNTLQTNSYINVNGSFAEAVTLRASSYISVANNATFAAGQNWVSGNTITFNGSADLELSGAIMSAAKLASSGRAVTFSGESDVDVDAVDVKSLVLQDSADVNVTNDLTTGDITVGSGTAATAGKLVATGNASVSGTLTVGAESTIAGALRVDNGGTLQDSEISVTGSITDDANIISSTLSAEGDITSDGLGTVESNNTLKAAAGITVSGAIDGTGNTLETTGTGADIELQGDVNTAVTATATGTLTLTSGVTSVASEQNWTAESLAIQAAKEIELDNSTVSVTSAVTSQNDLTISGGTALTATSVDVGANKLTLSGEQTTVETDDGSKVELTAGTVALVDGMSLMNAVVSASSFTREEGTSYAGVTFSMTGAQDWGDVTTDGNSYESDGTLTYGNISGNGNSATSSVSDADAIVVNGVISGENTQLSATGANGAITVGAISGEGTTISSTSGKITVNGAITAASTISTSDGGDVELRDDVSASAITSSGDLDIIKNGGVTISDSDLGVTGAITGNALTISGSKTPDKVHTAGSVDNEGLTVSEATTLNVTNTVETSGALVVAGSLTAGSDVTGAAGSQIFGTVSSTAGNISLTGATVSGAVSTTAGDISLTGGTVTGGSLAAGRGTDGGDLVLDNESVSGADLTIANDLQMTNGSSITDVTDVTAGNSISVDNSTISGVTEDGVVAQTGSISVTNGGTIGSTAEANSIIGNVSAATTITVDNGTIAGVTGNVAAQGELSVQNGGSVATVGGSVISQDAIEVTGTDSSITNVTGDVVTGTDKDMTITGGGSVSEVDGTVSVGKDLIIGQSTTGNDGSSLSDVGTLAVAGAMTVTGGDVSGVTTGTVGSALILQNDSTMKSTELEVKGDITVDATSDIGGAAEDAVQLTSTEGNVEVDHIGSDAATSDGNVLTSEKGDVAITQGITGSENILTAALDITTGEGITGNENELRAEGDIVLGATDGKSIDGDNNIVLAQGNVTLLGSMGENNTVKAYTGGINVQTDISGTGGVYKAGSQVVVLGSVTGSNHTLLSYGKGVGLEDVAVSIGEFCAQGSTIGIATENDADPEYGTPINQGSVRIDSMTGPAVVDGTLMNSIYAAGNVEIGSLTDFSAYTTIRAGKTIVVEGVSTASNQTWQADDLSIGTAGDTEGLTLTNSTLNIANSISGSSLTLTADSGTPVTDSLTRYSSVVASVNLTNLSLTGTFVKADADAGTVGKDDSVSLTVTGNLTVTGELTITNNALLKVDGTATIGSLTLDGEWATLLASEVTVDTLTLLNGATFDSTKLSTSELILSGPGTMSLTDLELKGVMSLTAENSLILTVTGDRGLVDLTGDVTAENNSQILVTDDLQTGASIASNGGADGASLISASSISAGQTITADGGNITSTIGGITAGTGLSATNGTISSAGTITAMTGDVAANEGGSITAAGAITAAGGSVRVDGGSISGDSVTSSGSMSVSAGGTIAATAGSVTAQSGISGTDGSVSAAGGIDVTGSVSNTGAGTRLELTAGGAITVSEGVSGGQVVMEADSISITGDLGDNSNDLDSQADISISGSITGDGNTVDTVTGNIITAAVAGTANTLTAGGAIEVAGDVAAGNTLTAGGNIGAGSLAGTDTLASTRGDITVDGAVKGGSNTLSAVTGDITVGSVAETTEDAKNVLTAQQGTVTIKSLEDGGDYTCVQAKNIVIGEAGGSALTAEYQTWDGVNLTIAGAGLELVDSHLSLTGTVSGSSLTLTSTGARAYSAQNVDLDSLTLNSNSSLTLSGNAQVTNLTINDQASMTVAGSAEIGTLTLDGDSAIFRAADSTITNLVLKNGAHYDGVTATVTGVSFESGSTVSVEDLEGITDLSVGSNTFVYVTGNQGLTQLEQDLEVTDESLLAVSGSLATDGSILASGSSSITGADITAGGSVSADGGSISSTTGGITAGSGVSATNGTISSEAAIAATAGDVTASAGGTITAAGIVAGADVAATGGSIFSTAGDVTAAGAVSATDGGSISVTGGGITTGTPALGADPAINGSITVEGGSITATGAISATTGDVTVDAGSIAAGDTLEIAEGDLNLSNKGSVSAENGITLENGSVTATDGSINGDLTLDGAGSSVRLTDTTLDGSLSFTAANEGVWMDNSLVTGDITGANSLLITNSSEVLGDVTLTGDGVLTISQSVIHGAVSGVNEVGLVDTVVTESITSGKDLTIIGGEVQGMITITDPVAPDPTPGTVTLVGTTVGTSNGLDLSDPAHPVVTPGSGLSVDGAYSLDASGTTLKGGVALEGGEATLSATSVGADKDGNSLTGATSLEATKGTSLAGDVALVQDADGDATATVDASTVQGSITGATVATVTAGSVIAGDLVLQKDADGDAIAAVDASTVQGSITGATGASVTGGSVTGNIEDAGAVTVSDSTTGDITATGDIGLTKASVGSVSTTDGDVTVTGEVLADSVSGLGLTVNKYGSLTAETGDVIADGVVTISGALTAQKGSIVLDGDETSTITADVTAEQNVTLIGEIAASGTEEKPIGIAASMGAVTLDGTLDTAFVAVSGESIAVNGTLNAGAGTVLSGTVAGAGTINKTGGDELVLAADTNMAGGQVNVSDGSTLLAEGGHLGAVTVTAASTLVVGGDSNVATELLTDSLTMEAGSKLQATLNLAGAKADKVTAAGSVDLKGATLVLDSTVAAEEAAVADQTRLTVVGCTVLSGLSEDVEHSMETLNAHVENFGDHIDVVLSKNYKGASKTPNQSQVAAALQTINAAEVEGTEMGAVLDALAHTRSEADAKAALDSLGGAGLAGIQKVISEESREHMQTLRSTLSGLNQGIARRIAEDGSIIPGINSSAVSASITGSTSNVSGDGNVHDYSRSSMGFILAGAHAVNKNWSFGGGFAWSSSTASCSSVDIDSDAFYFDAAVMYNKGRLHQTGTVGVGFYGFDTDRNIAVRAAGHDYSDHAKGSTSGTAVNLSYEVSYDLIISQDGHHTFSPVGVAEATFAQVKDMREGGAGNVGLTSRFDDVQSLTVGGGARYTYNFGLNAQDGFVSAEALVLGVAGDDTMMVRNNFIAGGTPFEMMGPKSGGVGLRFNVNALVPIDEQWSVLGNVAAEFRSDQSAVSGSVGLKYAF